MVTFTAGLVFRSKMERGRKDCGIKLALGFELDQPTTAAIAFRTAGMRRRPRCLSRSHFALVAAALDLLALILAANGIGSQTAALHVGMTGDLDALPGFLGAVLFCCQTAARGDYAAAHYIENAHHLGRLMFSWLITFATALFILTVVRESVLVDRGSSLAMFAGGFAVLVVARWTLVSIMKRLAATGRFTLTRIALVGSEAELKGFIATVKPDDHGIEIASCSVLRGPETLEEDLVLAAAIARVRQPNAIHILSSWSNGELVQTALRAMMNVPAEVHLGQAGVLDRFTQAVIARTGPIASLHLVRHPQTALGRAGKRLIDFFGGSALLVVSLPLFILLALLIKADSAGPVFFAQRRYGFNQRPFRILKFRSMRVLEDGSALVQARRGDTRVTRIGRIMRRSNLDELPQLINVIKGEMSLVGPRPHALAHNHQYEQAIVDYARRHNVKPGITGWAQVNGLRGETSTDELMRARVEHDLFYIDNLSIGFDLRILAATLSSKARRNAY